MAAGDIILEIDHLSAGYTDEPVVVDFSAAILEGTVTTVIGPNGAGKSTLLRALYGLIRHFAGSVRFPGQAIERLPPRERLTRGTRFVELGRLFMAGPAGEVIADPRIKVAYLGGEATGAR